MSECHPTIAVFSHRGVHEVGHNCLINTLADGETPPWTVDERRPDAAIDRGRGVSATEFLRNGGDVLLQIDDDIEYTPEHARYICEVAHLSQAVVGGLYSKRQTGQGWAGKLPPDFAGEIGSDDLIEMPEDSYLGGGFVAYPRSAFARLIDWGICVAWQGFAPFFQPALKVVGGPIIHPWEMAEWRDKNAAIDHLSEDWAACHYFREAGVKVLLSMGPVLVHMGEAGFSALSGVEGKCGS